MNKLGLLIIAMLATSTALASTLPASAQEPYNDHAPDYGTGHGDGAGYGYSGSNGSCNPSSAPGGYGTTGIYATPNGPSYGTPGYGYGNTYTPAGGTGYGNTYTGGPSYTHP